MTKYYHILVPLSPIFGVIEKAAMRPTSRFDRFGFTSNWILANGARRRRSNFIL